MNRRIKNKKAKRKLAELIRFRENYEINCAICGYSSSEIERKALIDSKKCRYIKFLNSKVNTEYGKPYLEEKELDEIVKSIRG